MKPAVVVQVMPEIIVKNQFVKNHVKMAADVLVQIDALVSTDTQADIAKSTTGDNFLILGKTRVHFKLSRLCFI